MNYNEAKVTTYQFDHTAIALRSWGRGPDLLFIHGFCVHGYTWRKLVADLAKSYTCHVVDLPGFGDSEWTKAADLSFTAQAERLAQLIDKLGWQDLSIIAQDTGASIARLIALSRPLVIKDLIMINTEIPYHRPPFIPIHQFLAKLPLANPIFRLLLKIGPIVRSPLLFAPFFYDKSLLKQKEQIQLPYVARLQTSHQMYGMLIVDDFADTHSQIKANVLLVWGEEDRTFPLHLAKAMMRQFTTSCSLAVIPKACLMPHEERPREVLSHIRKFLTAPFD